MQKFGDELIARQEREGDCESLPQSLLIARGEKQLGRFSLTTVSENLASNLFLPQDWYWSEHSQMWLTLEAVQNKLPRSRL